MLQFLHTYKLYQIFYIEVSTIKWFIIILFYKYIEFFIVYLIKENIYFGLKQIDLIKMMKILYLENNQKSNSTLWS